MRASQQWALALTIAVSLAAVCVARPTYDHMQHKMTTLSQNGTAYLANSNNTICATNYYPTGVCTVFCSPSQSCSGVGSCTSDGKCSCPASKIGVDCSKSIVIAESQNRTFAGSAGGTVSLGSGATDPKIVFPAGAFSGSKTISMGTFDPTDSNTPTVPASQSEKTLKGPVYRFLPSGLTFASGSEPTVYLQVNDPNLGINEVLKLHKLNETTNTWFVPALDAGTYDPATGLHAAKVASFSIYAVLSTPGDGSYTLMANENDEGLLVFGIVLSVLVGVFLIVGVNIIINHRKNNN